MELKTKIIATIGPASRNKAVLEQLIAAGVNVARLNFSHGSYEDHVTVIRRVRSISRTLNLPVGILLDLQGPKIRIGKLEEGRPVRLTAGQPFTITTRPMPGNAQRVCTTYAGLARDVAPKDTILLDDGLIRLEVEQVSPEEVACRVVTGGLLGENKGINLPGVSVSAPSLTEKDRRDVNFGIQNSVDYFALSFVRRAEDILDIKAMLARQGSAIPVVAKIEKPEAVENLDGILEQADALMVARGDLGVEMNPEFVPTIQKHIIHRCRQRNRLVITATQMLETMSLNPIPTRAEASDVANAIFDGTDAVMLSGETASGQYPLEAVRMMAKIAHNSENSPFMAYNIQYATDPQDPITHAVAQSAVNILHEIDAKCIVAFSVSGGTSRQISKQRPSKPVYAFSSRMDIYNRLSLLWGVTPMYIPNIDNAQRLIRSSENLLIQKGFVQTGDLIVLVIGMGLTEGSTNMIKIHRVGHMD
ncbi:MAG: pyruvate kinase [Desulfobacterales bacterium]